jgi:hypothetical protein
VFLGLDNRNPDVDANALFDLVIGVAAGTLGKAEVAEFVRAPAHP